MMIARRLSSSEMLEERCSSEGYTLSTLRDQLYHWSLANLGLTYEADDVAQKIFEKLLKPGRGIETYNDSQNFNSWLSRIVHNACVDVRRGWKRRAKEKLLIGAKISDEDEEGELDLIGASYTENNLGRLIDKEDASRIYNAMERLPYVNKEAMRLYYVDGLNYNQISRTLNIPQGTVKSRIHKAKKLLKEAITI